MGVPLSGPSYIYGDNMSIIHNTQRPESTLKKKSNSVCYHAVHKAVAMGECLMGHVSTHDNPADICTKIMPGGQKRDHLIGLIVYNLTDHTYVITPSLRFKGFFLGYLARPLATKYHYWSDAYRCILHMRRRSTNRLAQLRHCTMS